MPTVEILRSDARPQLLSPLFTRLPLELRLMIYTFVFKGCQVLFLPETMREYVFEPANLAGRLEERDVCRYKHVGGGLGLLRTCRMAFIEAFDTYWSEAVLRMSHCRTFEDCCNSLPAPIKANVRHIRNANLPILGKWRSAVEEPYRTPALLAEFPNLITCAFLSNRSWSDNEPLLADGRFWNDRRYLLKVPGREIRAEGYEGVGPFQMRSGEKPAAFIERLIGVRLSDGVTILSEGLGGYLEDGRYTFRVSPVYICALYKMSLANRLIVQTQFFNWATAMVYQISPRWRPIKFAEQEDAYWHTLRAQPGDEWSYYILDD